MSDHDRSERPGPRVPVPFWQWPWGSVGPGARGYYVYRMAVRPVLVVAAILAAVLVVVDVAPRVHGAVFWRNVEYDKLRGIHAGYDLEAVTEVLGPPTISRSVGDTEYRELLFVRREHYVQALVDDQGTVAMYGVVSCSESFQPTFAVTGELVLRLQEAPLGSEQLLQTREPDVLAEGSEPSDPLAEERRSLLYQPGSTGSTPQNYQEWSGPPSTATLQRTWFVGVNPLCVADSDLEALPGESFQGPVDEAPVATENFRDRFAANSYTETSDALFPTISELGMVLVPQSGSFGGLDCRDCEPVFVGPWSFLLPPATTVRGGTRTFD